jgi:allantoate deiminase
MTAARAGDVVRWCRELATCSEDPGGTTRTYLSAPMRDVHDRLSGWMRRLGMQVHVDAVGNLRGVRPGIRTGPDIRRLLIGSHLDTVPDAGAFDGVLGVVLGVALVDMLARADLPFELEVIGFSEEEGVRFGEPFIGSRALVGTVDAALLDRRDAAGISLRDSIAAGGLDLTQLPAARIAPSTLGYLEFHIEQGPALESADLPVGIVDAIAGQTRLSVAFDGQAAHAGTTPMRMRRDALAGAAEWIAAVERDARNVTDLVATVGRIDVEPNASNVIPSRVVASLDIRHAQGAVKDAAVGRLVACAETIARQRTLRVTVTRLLEQSGTPLDARLASLLEQCVAESGVRTMRLTSGAGHDAMILATVVPSAMLFLRSPGGVSHHPSESVREDDVAVALEVGRRFIDRLASEHA